MHLSWPPCVLYGMGAIAHEITGWEDTAFELYGTGLFSRGVHIQRERRCPHCNSIIYSRRHRVCGVCCEPLPVACTFSEEESASVKSLLQEERERHRKWRGKVNFDS
jgi:hypothetical protein